ncbi:hypothetical protein ONS95_006731 [Cadophora gregata]|uniref:uncharacterized protein n=1 Tax=Cadophora gregata TaxID=51156 RepID=UPI0026DC6FC5|nr:uncharacterized protein ONS95_006731 [Cadophora gregata]KAK0101565.1 hypothetical protein ONS95_006731 [Cadophora gregata]KAK0106420.1 hypothetical protein ONS96_004051 [Cadophora gregata f. sp. sojae]
MMPSPLSTQVIQTSDSVVTALHTTLRNIFVALDDGTVRVFDINDGHERILQASQKGGVWALDTWFEEGREEEEWLAVGGTDCLVGIWLVGSLDKKVSLAGHQMTVRCISTLSTSRVLSGSRDTTLRIWNINTATCEAILEGHTKTIRQIAVKDNVAVSASYDSDARVWDLETGTCLHVLKDHTEKLYAVAFDGKRIVTGSMDKTVRVWDPVSGTCQTMLQGHTSLITFLDLSSSNLISTSAGGDIFSWSLENYSKNWEVSAHDNSVTTLQRNEEIFITGGSDGRVKVWNAQTGAEIINLLSSDAVWQVAILGQKILTLFSRNKQIMMEFWAVPASS